jgi:hypothetical protein
MRREPAPGSLPRYGPIEGDTTDGSHGVEQGFALIGRAYQERKLTPDR